MKKPFQPIVVAILIAALAFSLRLPGMGSFMTADEENWMIRSGEFWHNLFLNNDPGGTFRTSHPGVITMWLAGGGIFLQEHKLGFHIDTSNLSHFRKAATLPIALATAIMIGVAAWLAARLKGLVIGSTAGFLLAVDPYLTGMSQIVHLDALLALFMLNAVLAFLIFWQEKRKSFLIAAGIFTGLALLNKLLPALWLFVFFSAYLLAQTSPGLLPRLKRALRINLLLIGIVGLMFFALWPTLLVMKNTTDYFARDAVTIVTDEHVALEISAEPINPASFYLRTILGRTTPLMMALWIVMVIVNIQRTLSSRRVNNSTWLILYTIGFIVLITLVAKKGDRYALPALAAIIFTASEGLIFIWNKIRQQFPLLQKTIVRKVLVGVLATLLIIQTGIWTPYAIAYNNPLFDVRPYHQQGWGEGLDAAARWVNSQPFDERLYIASWYPSVTATYFKGKTMSLSSRDDHRVGYVIIYRNMEGRAEDEIASNVLDEFKDQQPIHTIAIGGRPYVWIYNVLGPYYFRQHVGEITGQTEVGQIIPVPMNNWNQLDIGLATFGRVNTSRVTLHLRENMHSLENIRTVTISGENVPDQDWQKFTFEPIANSGGKEFYAAITSDAEPGNALTVRYSSNDIMPGQAVINGRARAGDLAYRITSSP